MRHRLVRTSTPVFDPGTLTLKEWQKAPFSSSPWADATGNGFTLSEATNPPTSTASINGLNYAHFDGSNDRLGGTTLSNIMSTSAYSGWALVNLDSIANVTYTQPGNGNPMIACSNGTAQWGIILYGNPSNNVVHHMFDSSSTDRSISTAISTAVWQLVQWRAGSGTMEIRVNSGTWQTTAYTTGVQSLAASLDVARNVNQNVWQPMGMADFGSKDTRLTDTDFDNIKSYCNLTYGLSL